MDNYLEQIKGAAAFIDQQVGGTFEVGIVLGTGLGALADEIEVSHELNYSDIPHFPQSTVESHAGKLLFGTLSGKLVVAMQGRFHYYEGYDMKEVTFPMRVMKFLGVKLLMMGSAVGGLNPDYATGDLMIINDHINLQGEHPLRGKNYDELGPRFPDMLHTYDKSLVAKGMSIAKAHDMACHEGVYLSLQGPTLETPAEYRFLYRIGADVVGMSTVPEVIVARHMGMKVFAICAITDMGYPPENIREMTLEEIIQIAGECEPKMTLIIKTLLEQL